MNTQPRIVPKLLDREAVRKFLKDAGLDYSDRQVRRMFDERAIPVVKVRGERYSPEEKLREWLAQIAGSKEAS